MGTCNIDHSLLSVQKKLTSQEAFMPAQLVDKLSGFLETEQSQEMLNAVFHLLKKYDLAPKEEQENRDRELIKLIGQ